MYLRTHTRVHIFFEWGHDTVKNESVSLKSYQSNSRSPRKYMVRQKSSQADQYTLME